MPKRALMRLPRGAEITVIIGRRTLSLRRSGGAGVSTLLVLADALHRGPAWLSLPT
jgi:hypothetical protein